MKKFPFLFLFLHFFYGCIISYSDFPKKEKTSNPKIYFSVEDPKNWNERRKEFLKRGWKELELDRFPQKNKDRIHFLISRFPGLSSQEPEVRKALSAKGWKEIENYPPEKGYYIDMKSSQKDPSLGAMIFLYISYATFTIIPSYSGKDGANIIFTVYKDNTVVKTFEYELTRKAFVWILTLPLLWLNYIYPSEMEAYQAVIDQFESDLYSSKL
ncbi:hypothetical protein [Leptospira andrefontaineae]|uniref:Lipoprotein n=1 Tax=Leptospira andrefontaineae TaxID=2484976 RepID=A0A4R9GYH7_9LEPT|nr:hypothetical protein [Leptospira andrefontaineae]TGK36520.1 hypothetical protein EHO65_17125 [Leptospira andrefontaineae]